MRVAVSGLRSLLRVATPLLEPGWVAELRAELGWLADCLGRVRDLEVLSATLQAQAARLDGGDAVVAAELFRPLIEERERARQALVSALSGVRYARLCETIAATQVSLTSADVSLEQLAAREFKRLRKRGRLGANASNAALHKRRIRAK